MIIKYPTQDIDLDDWAVLRVHPLHQNEIYPLIEKKEYGSQTRYLYYCGNKFVLYAPDLGVNVLQDFSFQIHYDCYGFESRRKYVGECADVNQLILFLTENTPGCL